MNTTKHFKLRYIATKVRRACYLLAHSEEAKDFDYFVYADGEYDNSLCGMCAIASYALAEHLNKAGFKAHVVEGKHADGWRLFNYGVHCWVLVEDEIIVDITASQYNRGGVHIVSKKDKCYRSPQKRHNYDSFLHWAESQRPTEETTQLIKKIAEKEYKPRKFNKEEWVYQPTVADYLAL